MHRTLRYLLPLLLATVTAASTAAETPWYQIEIVVFENLTPGQSGSEVWADDPGQPDSTTRVNLVPWASRDSAKLPTAITQSTGNAAGTETASDQASDSAEPESAEPLSTNDGAGLYPFVALPEKFLRLKETKRKLAQSSQYRVLLHTGWRQPLTKSTKGHSVHIGTGTEAVNLGGMTAPLDGNITVSLSRYLHLHADLVLRRQAKAATPTPSKLETSNTATQGTAESSAEAPMAIYRMLQSRRMRSTEIHYLDHPALGVIAQIVPVKAAASAN